MYHSLSDLLYEVNRVAKAPTVEDLRESVTRNLIQVYKKVDAPSLWQGAVHHYTQPEDSSGKLTLPLYCLLPLNLISGKANENMFDEMGRYSGSVYSAINGGSFGSHIPFKNAGDKIWIASADFYYQQISLIAFPSTLSYWRIPLDDEGVPLVDDRIWAAAMYYCQAEEARIALHGKNTQSFSVAPYQVDKQEANAAIDAARAFCNKMTPNNWRAFFENR